MWARFSLAWLAWWPLLATTLPGQPFQLKKSEFDATQRYLVLGTYRTSTLQKELSRAARAGYRVVAGWSQEELVVLLENVTDPPVIYQYRLVATFRTSTMEKELREAGAAGFRVVPQAMFLNSIQRVSGFPEIVMVMEKAPNSADTYEYRLVFDHNRGSLLPAVPEGYAVAGMVSRDQLTDVVVSLDRECEDQGGHRSECEETESRLVSVQHILVVEKLKQAPPLPPGAKSRPDVLFDTRAVIMEKASDGPRIPFSIYCCKA